jgi:hypothetical protein
LACCFVDFIDVDYFFHCTMIATLYLPQRLLVSEFLRERLVDLAAAVIVCVTP